MTRGEEGFSLIEALVALAILAVAAVGLVRAAEAQVDSIAALEDRAAAGWAAENRLAERALVPDGGSDGAVEMMGRRWQVASTLGGTDDPDLRTLQVAVRKPGAPNPLVTLDGFLDAGTTTVRR